MFNVKLVSMKTRNQENSRMKHEILGSMNHLFFVTLKLHNIPNTIIHPTNVKNLSENEMEPEPFFSEVFKAFNQFKYRKSPGMDRVVGELLRHSDLTTGRQCMMTCAAKYGALENGLLTGRLCHALLKCKYHRMK